MAEAVERGFNVGDTAKEHYNKAIEASFESWGAHGAADYLATDAVYYTKAHGNFKEKIGTQKWIALYNRGFEAWTEWRRFDFPRLNMPEGKYMPIFPFALPILSISKT